MSYQRKKSSPSSHNSSISLGNLQGSSNVHPLNLAPQSSGYFQCKTQHNANSSKSFDQFDSLVIPSTPKPTEILYTQESRAKTVADTQHIITSICKNYLFPRVKFLNHCTDLDFSFNQKSICQHVLLCCNLAQSVDKQA